MFSKERLREARERRGIARSAMSELCGLATGAVRRYERGERIPNADALEKMADFLGIPIDDFFDRNSFNKDNCTG